MERFPSVLQVDSRRSTPSWYSVFSMARVCLFWALHLWILSLVLDYCYLAVVGVSLILAPYLFLVFYLFVTFVMFQVFSSIISLTNSTCKSLVLESICTSCVFFHFFPSLIGWDMRKILICLPIFWVLWSCLCWCSWPLTPIAPSSSLGHICLWYFECRQIFCHSMLDCFLQDTDPICLCSYSSSSFKSSSGTLYETLIPGLYYPPFVLG